MQPALSSLLVLNGVDCVLQVLLVSDTTAFSLPYDLDLVQLPISFLRNSEEATASQP